MLVKFKRKWFGPDGRLYGERGVDEVSDSLRDKLPSDAKIEGEPKDTEEQDKPSSLFDLKL